MTSIVREINLDVAALNYLDAIVAKQYDRETRFLKVQLCNNGVDFQVESSATVLISACREDGTSASFAGEVNPDGTVQLPITYWMVALDGTVKCDVSIIEDTSVLTTMYFEITVQEAVASNKDIEEDTNYGVLVSLISQVSKIQKEEDRRVIAENERVEAENSRVQWLNAATERIQILEDNASATAESAAQSLEKVQQEASNVKKWHDAISENTTAAENSAKTAEAAKESAAVSATNAENSASEARKQATAASDSAESADNSAAKALESEEKAERYAIMVEGRVTTDKTLTVDGAAADAKATGDALSGKLESTSHGYVKALDISGNTLTMTYGDGTTNSVQLAESYTLPAATAETLGGVKVGANLSIDASGLLSGLADGGEIVASGTGYIRYANGMQICWGNTTTASIAFPVPFADTNLAVTAMDQYALEYTTTTMNSVKSGRIVGNWVVIGRWK